MSVDSRGKNSKVKLGKLFFPSDINEDVVVVFIYFKLRIIRRISARYLMNVDARPNNELNSDQSTAAHFPAARSLQFIESLGERVLL